MSVITYNGEQYKARTFLVQIPDEDERREITISTSDLSEAMSGKYETHGTPEEAIDADIYFYVHPNVIDEKADEICALHLDCPIQFYEEIESVFDYVILTTSNEWLASGFGETEDQIKQLIEKLKEEHAGSEIVIVRASKLTLETITL